MPKVIVMKTALPILLALASALLLTACASDGDMWGRHDHHGDHRDRDGDHHGAIGALTSPTGMPAPVTARS